MQSVIETPSFLADAKAGGVTDGERAAIVDFLAANPMAGDEIARSGGARKVRDAGGARAAATASSHFTAARIFRCFC